MLPTMRSSSNVPSVWDEFFGDSFLTNLWSNENLFSLPSVNIADDEKTYRIEVAAPGMNKEDFRINLEENVLTISSEKEKKHEEKDKKYMRREFSYASFNRSFILPDTSDEEKISATYRDGVLHIEIPKKEESRRITKSIKVA